MVRKSLVTAVIAGLTLLSTSSWAFDGPAYSRAKAAGPQGDTWESIAKLPDWKGAWGMSRESFGLVVKTSDTTGAQRIPPFNAKYAEMHDISVRQRKGGESYGNNSAHCLPNGMPSIMSAAFAYEFLLTPGQVTIIPESNEVRRVFTDGRKHPDDLLPTWEGHSIGHWENGTLVVDTVGLNGKSEMFVGMHATRSTHVVERIHRKDAQTMQIDTTMYNDTMFTKPYQYTRLLTVAPLGMQQAFCTENNRDNNVEVDLTPPPLE
ncbi:MAG: hypothetical protein QM808_02715 [Steroidobacteraceae bacterium]